MCCLYAYLALSPVNVAGRQAGHGGDLAGGLLSNRNLRVKLCLMRCPVRWLTLETGERMCLFASSPRVCLGARAGMQQTQITSSHSASVPRYASSSATATGAPACMQQQTSSPRQLTLNTAPAAHIPMPPSQLPSRMCTAIQHMLSNRYQSPC